MGEFRDFDEFFAEQNRVGPKLKLYGETHELAPSLPASVMARIVRMEAERGGSEEINPSELMELSNDVFGEDRIADWFERGLDVEQLSELLKWAISSFVGGNDPGEAETPAK